MRMQAGFKILYIIYLITETCSRLFLCAFWMAKIFSSTNISSFIEKRIHTCVVWTWSWWRCEAGITNICDNISIATQQYLISICCRVNFKTKFVFTLHYTHFDRICSGHPNELCFISGSHITVVLPSGSKPPMGRFDAGQQVMIGLRLNCNDWFGLIKQWKMLLKALCSLYSK